jgi:hypothetical protein
VILPRLYVLGSEPSSLIGPFANGFGLSDGVPSGGPFEGSAIRNKKTFLCGRNKKTFLCVGPLEERTIHNKKIFLSYSFQNSNLAEVRVSRALENNRQPEPESVWVSSLLAGHRKRRMFP